MQTIATTFTELGLHFGVNQPNPTIPPIPEWEERYINRIGQMLEAVKKAMLPVCWDWELESFIIERPSTSGYNYRRLLWSEGNEYVFGDEDGNEYATSTSLKEIMNRITKWANAKFTKK